MDQSNLFLPPQPPPPLKSVRSHADRALLQSEMLGATSPSFLPVPNIFVFGFNTYYPSPSPHEVLDESRGPSFPATGKRLGASAPSFCFSSSEIKCDTQYPIESSKGLVLSCRKSVRTAKGCDFNQTKRSKKYGGSAPVPNVSHASSIYSHFSVYRGTTILGHCYTFHIDLRILRTR